MYKKGIPISYIRDFLGHKKIETTSIYSYADDETITEILEAVDKIDTHPTVATEQKEWKGKEQYLIDFCGLS